MNRTLQGHQISMQFGIGLRKEHYAQILASKLPDFDWLEVITENFLGSGGRPREVLEQACCLYPVAFHGVGLSIGGLDELRSDYLVSLKSLVQRFNPIVVSDHLCFTSLGGHSSHDLLPVPYSRKSLHRIIERLNRIQDLLGRQFVLENPSAYIAYEKDDFTESEFFCELFEKTKCGMLLDVNNLVVNQCNLGQSATKYIEMMPSSAVVQIHLAGHSIQRTELGTVRIDTHDAPVPEEVFELYEFASKKFSTAYVMIERDDHIPELDVLKEELQQVRQVSPHVNQRHPTHIDHVRGLLDRDHLGDLRSDQAQSAVFNISVSPLGIDANDSRLSHLATNLPVPHLLGARVYNGAYFARLRETLENQFPSLVGVTTEEGFTAMAARYIADCPPKSYSIDHCGRQLSEWLRVANIPEVDFGVPLAILADLAALDQARYDVFVDENERDSLPVSALGEISAEQWDQVSFKLSSALRVLNLTSDVLSVTQDLNAGKPPRIPSIGSYRVLVARSFGRVFDHLLNDEQSAVIQGVQHRRSFSEICGQWCQDRCVGPDESAAAMSKAIVEIFNFGLVLDIEI